MVFYGFGDLLCVLVSTIMSVFSEVRCVIRWFRVVENVIFGGLKISHCIWLAHAVRVSPRHGGVLPVCIHCFLLITIGSLAHFNRVWAMASRNNRCWAGYGRNVDDEQHML